MAQNFKDNGQLLPKELTNAIMLKGYEDSVVGRLAGNTPIKFGETSIPIFEGGSELGLVEEAGEIGTSTVSTKFKTLSPVKLATILTVSRELAELDPAEMMTHIEADLAAAVAKAYDNLILGGKAKGVAVLGQEFINQTTKRVEVAGGDYKSAIVAAVEAVAADYDPTAIAFDTSLRARLAGVVNETQVGLADLASPRLQIAGYNAEGARTVGANGAKLIVGDWSKVRAGFAEDVRVTRSTDATVNGVNMFANDMVALRVTTRIGGVILDTDAFAVIEDVVAG